MCRETKTPTRVTGMNADVQVIQGKGQKYLAFLTALTFHENYDDKEEKKEITCNWLVKELALQQRTNYKAALVCTIIKRCSLEKSLYA